MNRAQPYPRGTSNLDRKLLKAFGRGKMASDNWQLRSTNPHEPSGAPYAAWDCGWCEGEDVYSAPCDSGSGPSGRRPARAPGEAPQSGGASRIAQTAQKDPPND